MNALITGLTLLLTIFVAMALGIYAGYGVLMAMFRLMSHRGDSGAQTSVLVTSQAHSGD